MTPEGCADSSKRTTVGSEERARWKEAERDLDVQYSVVRILAGAKDTDESLRQVLDRICSYLAWDLGAFWQPQEGSLHCRHVIYAASFPAANFEEACLHTRLAPGSGLPGRVWATAEPAVIHDVTQDDN